jgi:hypothetical protein
MKIIDSFGGNEQIVESSNQVIENIEVDGKNNN